MVRGSRAGSVERDRSLGRKLGTLATWFALGIGSLCLGAPQLQAAGGAKTAPKAAPKAASKTAKVAKKKPVQHSNKYLELVPEQDAAASPASRYANLTNQQAFEELKRRSIPFTRGVPPAGGVRYPIRLLGPLHGVTIHSVLPPEERADTPFEIMDARLALALDDFCRILERHDIVELVHFTIYRPPPEVPKDPRAGQYRHPGGLAIDAGAFKKSNGQWLAIGPHWSSEIGARTCGDGARALTDLRGRELMSILCEASDQRLFHYMLSPHFDAAHADHVHLEIKPGVKWFLVN
jgi:hypothetical protein